MNLEKLKYPIGNVEFPTNISSKQVEGYIKDINAFPQKMIDLVKDLSIESLNQMYRPGGWKIKQVVHHCADSHMNAVIRLKWTLTEDGPTIKPYIEEKWAELADGVSDDISFSLLLLQGIHQKWSLLLDALSAEDLDTFYIHPTEGITFTMKKMLCLYAWHGNHHLAHIRQALKYKGDFSDLA